MTALLTISSMFGSITTVTPPVSYTTKLDFWMVMCITCVFCTLLEFTVVIFVKYYIISKVPREKTLAKKRSVSSVTPFKKVVGEIREKTFRETREELEEKARVLVRKIDKVAIVLFLIAFVLFNVIYWTDIVRVERKNNQWTIEKFK